MVVAGTAAFRFKQLAPVSKAMHALLAKGAVGIRTGKYTQNNFMKREHVAAPDVARASLNNSLLCFIAFDVFQRNKRNVAKHPFAWPAGR